MRWPEPTSSVNHLCPNCFEVMRDGMTLGNGSLCRHHHRMGILAGRRAATGAAVGVDVGAMAAAHARRCVAHVIRRIPRTAPIAAAAAGGIGKGAWRLRRPSRGTARGSVPAATTVVSARRQILPTCSGRPPPCTPARSPFQRRLWRLGGGGGRRVAACASGCRALALGSCLGVARPGRTRAMPDRIGQPDAVPAPRADFGSRRRARVGGVEGKSTGA